MEAPKPASIMTWAPFLTKRSTEEGIKATRCSRGMSFFRNSYNHVFSLSLDLNSINTYFVRHFKLTALYVKVELLYFSCFLRGIRLKSILHLTSIKEGENMFKGQSIFEIISAGGFTMYILIFCSVISIAVIIERMVYYNRRSQFSRVEF